MLIDHSALFAALADPTRRRVFELLSKQPQSVARVSSALPVSRPAVSQHLKVLLKAGLVSVQQQGTRRVYQADIRGIAAMRQYLDGAWNDTLRFAEEATRE